MLKQEFDAWQNAGWIPSWRIEPGDKTDEPIRTKGWTHWHHMFTPRQLLMNGYYSKKIGELEPELRAALMLNLGRVLDSNSKLCHWKVSQGGALVALGQYSTTKH